DGADLVAGLQLADLGLGGGVLDDDVPGVAGIDGGDQAAVRRQHRALGLAEVAAGAEVVAERAAVDVPDADLVAAAGGDQGAAVGRDREVGRVQVQLVAGLQAADGPAGGGVPDVDALVALGGGEQEAAVAGEHRRLGAVTLRAVVPDGLAGAA